MTCTKLRTNLSSYRDRYFLLNPRIIVQLHITKVKTSRVIEISEHEIEVTEGQSLLRSRQTIHEFSITLITVHRPTSKREGIRNKESIKIYLQEDSLKKIFGIRYHNSSSSLPNLLLTTILHVK